ncbi:MAG: hypothetical protein IAE66_02300 [Xanthomonadaceae bacterium]|nr:hypothetical protein [Xanthomonadaceae bacterium]
MRRLMIPAAIAACLLIAPAAQAKDTRCTLKYDMQGGGAFYKRSNGTGRITCDNGQSMNVTIESKGGGLTFGSSKIEDGIGKFSPVLDIKNLIGGYATGEANAGGGSASKAQVVTKGTISLALTGRGTGRTLGVSFGSFIIKEAGK